MELAIDGPKAQWLIEPGPDGRLGVVRSVACGSGATGSALAWILVEGGSGTMAVGDYSKSFQGRDDVFSGPGWSMLVPPHTAFRIDGDLSWTLIWRHSDRAAAASILQPESVVIE